MTAKKHTRKLVISLITDDLIHAKLSYTLSDLGIDPGPYFLNLSNTAFQLMHIPDTPANDRLYERYLAYTQQVRTISMQNPAPGFINWPARYTTCCKKNDPTEKIFGKNHKPTPKYVKTTAS
jgi:hypothetical protein